MGGSKEHKQSFPGVVQIGPNWFSLLTGKNTGKLVADAVAIEPVFALC
jgi:hypothetical protein